MSTRPEFTMLDEPVTITNSTFLENFPTPEDEGHYLVGVPTNNNTLYLEVDYPVSTMTNYLFIRTQNHGSLFVTFTIVGDTSRPQTSGERTRGSIGTPVITYATQFLIDNRGRHRVRVLFSEPIRISLTEVYAIYSDADLITEPCTVRYYEAIGLTSTFPTSYNSFIGNTQSVTENIHTNKMKKTYYGEYVEGTLVFDNLSTSDLALIERGYTQEVYIIFRGEDIPETAVEPFFPNTVYKVLFVDEFAHYLTNNYYPAGVSVHVTVMLSR